MMRLVCLAAISVLAAPAAVISGVVLDRATARPLARAQVTLRPVDGTAGQAQSTRAGRGGQFHFVVAGGLYLVRAARNGFAPFEYGQREFTSAGKPVSVEPDGSLYLDIRLRRFGAISGTVLDENEIGIPDQKVIAYAARLPLRIAASALTDDRGVYRIHGLEPGAYYVRTAAQLLEDGSGLLPTFHKETSLLDQSVTVDVDLDRETDEIDIRPLPGKLFHVKARVTVHPPVPVTLTLISDTGRMVQTTAGDCLFDRLAPGHYELIAEAELAYGREKVASYQEFNWDTNTEIAVSLNSWRETEFRMQDEKGNRLEAASAKISARRKTLDGGGDPQLVELRDSRAALAPGRWEFSVTPPPGYYVVSVSSSYGLPEAQTGHPLGWIEVPLRGAITIKLSSRPASVHGLVSASQDAVPGAPVYLEAIDGESHTRLADLRSTRTGAHGRYRFTGLPPGSYRLLSTFEYQNPDPAAMEAAGARILTVPEGADAAQDLDLYAPQ